MPDQKKIDEIIRVNHAGEYGAKQIYSGQIAVFKRKNDPETLKLLKHMKEQEDEHFDYFDKQVVKKQIRPTLMQPLWKVAGFALGASTALLGKKAAMACTVAVEEVIDEHYQEQLDILDEKKDKELVDKIKKFQAEELEHRDIGIENEAKSLSYYQPLSSLIKSASKLAIKISKKI